MALIDTILWAVIIIFGLGIAGLILTIVVLVRKYKWLVNVKELVNGRIVKKRKRGCLVYKHGVPFIKVMGYRRYPCPVPPAEAIELSNKGKKCIEPYFSDGQFIFSRDNIAVINDDTLDNKLLDEKDRDTYKFFKWLWPKKFQGVVGKIGVHNFTREFIKTDKGFIEVCEWEKLAPDKRQDLFKDNKIPDKLEKETRNFQASKWLFTQEYDGTIQAVEPFTTEQRALLVNQEIKAQEDRGKSWQEMAVTIGAIAFVIFLLIMGYLYMDSWNEGKLETYEAMEQTSDNLKATSGNLASASSKWAQILGDDELDLSNKDEGVPN